jgi:hypothetical protein
MAIIMMSDVVFEHGNYLKLLSITKLLILIERLNDRKMKKYFPLMAFATAAFAACTSNSGSESAADSTITAETAVVAAAESRTCYVHYKNRDSIYLDLHTKGEQVSGTLNISLYEKDRNTGTVSGIMKGDTILLDYTFQSEGLQSVRQVAYLQKDGKLHEGFAEVQEQNGKTSFKSLSDLKFDEQVVLEQSNCK